MSGEIDFGDDAVEVAQDIHPTGLPPGVAERRGEAVQKDQRVGWLSHVLVKGSGIRVGQSQDHPASTEDCTPSSPYATPERTRSSDLSLGSDQPQQLGAVTPEESVMSGFIECRNGVTKHLKRSPAAFWVGIVR